MITHVFQDITLFYIATSGHPSCIECKAEKPDVYCPGCLGRFYHKPCFDKAKRHRPQDSKFRGHSKVPIELLNDLNYINTPNEQIAISDEEIYAAQEHQFIRVDDLQLTLTFGPRAVPLLRPPPPLLETEQDHGTSSFAEQIALGRLKPETQRQRRPFEDQIHVVEVQQRRPERHDDTFHPGFISFLGDTGVGKSFILRSLTRKFSHYPSPLSSPGKVSNAVVSTSSDISLYADGHSSSEPNPILFLDFEGLNGSDWPCTYIRNDLSPSPGYTETMRARRRHYVEVVYPRLAYAFSDCVVFLTTSTMQSHGHVAELITSFVNAAHGSRYQSLKPALLIIYNKFGNNDSDWSEEASTAAFLDPTNSSEAQVRELQKYFEPVRTIKIPSSRGKLGHITVAQLDQFEIILREEYRLARQRRLRSHMQFEPPDLIRYLSRALRIFSHPDDQAPVFDWVMATREHSPTVFSTTEFRIPAIVSFWKFCLNFWLLRKPNSPTESFKNAWHSFTYYLDFFIRLCIYRRTSDGIIEHQGIANDILQFQSKIAELDVPCSAKSDGLLSCGGTRGNHRPHLHESGVIRWIGDYQPAMKLEQLTNLIPLHSRNDDQTPLTVLDSPETSFLLGYLPQDACAGCIFLPVAVTLSCKHPMCETCIKEIVGSDHAFHRLRMIRCPICSKDKAFSPHFLPDGTGYRMLSLGPGGIHAISIIRVLQSLERQCFGIPIRHLFDFFIGAGAGGLLALAIASSNPPLSIGTPELEDRFCHLMSNVRWDNGYGFRAKHHLPTPTAVTYGNVDQFFKSHDNVISEADISAPYVAFTPLRGRLGPVKST